MSEDMQPTIQSLHKDMTVLRKDMEDGDARNEQQLREAKKALEMDILALRDKVTRIETKQDSHHSEGMTMMRMINKSLENIHEKALNAWPSSAIRWFVVVVISVIGASATIALAIVNWLPHILHLVKQ